MFKVGRVGRIGQPGDKTYPKGIDILSSDISELPSYMSFSRASAATYFDSSGVLQSATTDQPRLDYDPATFQPRGLLIEEARTNYVANSLMSGAVPGVIGSGGSAPTGMAFGGSLGVGINTEVISSGTINGIPYARVRIFGTSTESGSFRWGFNAQVAATTSQAWTNSLYMSLVSGSLSGFSSVNLEVREYSSGTASNILTRSITSEITSAPLASNRVSISGLTVGVGTTTVQPTMRWGFNNGATIEITVDIGGPQLEQASFATSLILSDGVATTRAADNAIISSLSSIGYNAEQGTLLAYFERISGANNTGLIADFGNGAYGNRIYMGYDSSSRVFANIFNGGVGQTQLLYTVSAPNKAAFAWSSASKSLSAGGLTTLTNSGGTLPTSISSMTIGKDTTSASGSYFNGWIRSLTYYPTRLSDATLQQLTQ